MEEDKEKPMILLDYYGCRIREKDGENDFSVLPLFMNRGKLRDMIVDERMGDVYSFVE